MSRGKKLVDLALLKLAQDQNKDLPDVPPLDIENEEARLDSPESDSQSEHSTHSTGTEQSGTDSEIDEEYFPRKCPMFRGKDKVTEWLKHAPKPKGRTKKHNIVSFVPSVKAVARHAKSPVGSWILFFPDATLQTIVIYTNKYLKKMRQAYGRERDCPDTCIDEIRALIGLLYLAGIKKGQHTNISELWSDDGTAPECFRATMSCRRFYTLLRALRFDDFDNREQRKSVDNLAPIRDLFEQFVERCRNNYQVGAYATIDEMLDAFRGRCKFRQYIANKPAKYGIKIYALVDARTFYTSNLEIYAGKQPDGPYKLDNKATSVVMRIAAPVLNSGRNLTMDSYFTSIPLAKDLLQNYRTTIVGTLRKNKREIPLELINIRDRKPRSSMFAFSKEAVLVSYVPKRSKNVLLLSTMHNDDTIDEDSGDKTKPEIVTFYNLTKGGVDVVDEMKSLYSVSRVSCRWPLTIFFSMLNIGGVNSYIIYRTNKDTDYLQRRVFLKELALSLIKPHLVNRSKIGTLQLPLRTAIARMAGINSDTLDENPVKPTKAGFCYCCPRRKNRKTKKTCSSCHQPICPEHTNFTCKNCFTEDGNA